MLEKKIQEIGRLVLGGDVVFALDSAMVLDRCAERVRVIRSMVKDLALPDDDVRDGVAQAFGIELGEP